MPCVSQQATTKSSDIFTIGFKIKEVDIFISDFGVPYDDVKTAWDYILPLYNSDYDVYEGLVSRAVQFWDYHFKSYPVNFDPFIKFAAYTYQNKIKLSKFARYYV